MNPDKTPKSINLSREVTVFIRKEAEKYTCLNSEDKKKKKSCGV